VNVDEAGSDYLSVRVDGPDSRGWSETADTRDTAIFDGDVGAKPGIAAAITTRALVIRRS
jgi:hypothetical protein